MNHPASSPSTPSSTSFPSGPFHILQPELFELLTPICTMASLSDQIGQAISGIHASQVTLAAIFDAESDDVKDFPLSNGFVKGCILDSIADHIHSINCCVEHLQELTEKNKEKLRVMMKRSPARTASTSVKVREGGS